MYVVEVIITNKGHVRDPEGETIYRDLIIKRGYTNVAGIRSGKYLKFHVQSDSCKAAVEYVKELCYKLRIYNPIVHDVEVRASGQSSCD
ncbi:MAG: phosphoribosylformylglycinamidine synthase subunit PurS [Sulfolobales archaeon]|nr:phosphoribosylformylglycinamidine synthase subunit PurS [Sulfolobales archaeon]MCX8186361.1 phosphoribosylformylglycinamidine synthase subunit PurS [Sulfolobales archaeon]MDW7968903.1 phosphoribosylformylglycinamidine synthase subunit PurS [Sulfolobales archaeon]